MITLSTHSSDETPAAVLNATMEFEVTGSTLTLTVTNNTTTPNAYRISELYFNGPAGLVLSFSSMPGWNYSTNGAADGFGVFDFVLTDGVGNNPHQVQPNGGTKVFTFTIISGTATAADFTTKLSSIPPGMTPAIAAAFFRGGPGDDSGYGAFIPSPAAGALLLTPLLLGRRRR